jgi:hypothetical protein
MAAEATVAEIREDEALSMLSNQQLDELRQKLQITPIDDGDDWIKALFYGDAGAGKTHLIGTASELEDLCPVLIFDVEGGLKTLRKFSTKDRIERKVIRSIEDLDKAYTDLYHSIKDGVLPYKTVGLDSLSELTDVDMRAIMKDAYNRNPETVNVDVPSQREWGIARNHVRKIVRAFRDLPCNVIMTAGLGVEQQPEQPSKFFPAFAGKLKMEVPGFFDIVGYMSTDTSGGDVVRQIQFLGSRRVVAKDRSGSLGEIITNPSFPKIWEMVNNPVNSTAPQVATS